MELNVALKQYVHKYMCVSISFPFKLRECDWFSVFIYVPLSRQLNIKPMLLSDLEEAVVDASSSAPPAANNGTEKEPAADSEDEDEDKSRGAKQLKKSGGGNKQAAGAYLL